MYDKYSQANSSGDDFQASWNLAQHIILEISGHLSNAGRNFLLGKLNKYFWYMNLIKRRIIPFMNPEERMDLKLKEDKLKELEPKWSVRPISVPEFSTLLEEYDCSIMDLLRKYGLLVPPKKDHTTLIG
jgi:hypothetical protein